METKKLPSYQIFMSIMGGSSKKKEKVEQLPKQNYNKINRNIIENDFSRISITPQFQKIQFNQPKILIHQDTTSKFQKEKLQDFTLQTNMQKSSEKENLRQIESENQLIKNEKIMDFSLNYSLGPISQVKKNEQQHIQIQQNILRIENKKLREDLKCLEQKFTMQQKQYLALSQILKNMENLMRDSQQQSQRKASQIRSVKESSAKQIEYYKKQIIQLNNKIHEMSNKNNSYVKQMNELNQQLEKKQKQINVHFSNQTELLNQSAKIFSECENYKKQIFKLQKIIEELTINNKQQKKYLMTELQKKSQQNKILKNNINKFQLQNQGNIRKNLDIKKHNLLKQAHKIKNIVQILQNQKDLLKLQYEESLIFIQKEIKDQLLSLIISKNEVQRPRNQGSKMQRQKVVENEVQQFKKQMKKLKRQYSSPFCMSRQDKYKQKQNFVGECFLEDINKKFNNLSIPNQTIALKTPHTPKIQLQKDSISFMKCPSSKKSMASKTQDLTRDYINRQKNYLAKINKYYC